MKKSLLIIVALLATNVLIAQVPQGFNYQAIARDTKGNTLPSTSLEIRIGILNSTDLVWQEDHSVVTSELGLFSIVIGDESATKSGGTVTSFDNIIWAQTAYMIEISIDEGSGFTSMGVTPFMSVPYAMYAQYGPEGNSGEWKLNSDTLYTSSSVGIGTSTPNESLLTIQSKDAQVEKPLFEVRNEMGNPVFAVFNDGVMVYVDEDKKGVKGGFAVGGYNKNTKGVTQEYLRITPDSVRIWVPEDNPAKGVKGGFAVGGYNKNSKARTQELMSINNLGDIYASGNFYSPLGIIFPIGKSSGVPLENPISKLNQVNASIEGESAVKYSDLIPLLIEAIKEQQSQLEAQQAEIDALKKVITNL